MQEAHDLFYNKTVHIKLSLLYIIALCCIYLNKSVIICCFLSVLCVKLGYEEEEYKDYPDT